MGKIVISENVTLDGVIQDPAGREDFRLGGWVGRIGDQGRERAAKVLLAQAIFDGVEKGDEEIFPDPFSQTQAESWRMSAAKELERQNAALIPAEPIAA